ncbi:hypothetical protein KR222_000609 [Zaprionus bogoriensis]|nr:hypothetical protein KR222_000609 [Zaprionus bogoriensis]
MNSTHTIPMPSGQPPALPRATCSDFSGERDMYITPTNLDYGGITTSSSSSYAPFGVLSSISGAGTGTTTIPLLLSAAPSTSTFKTTTTMPTSTPSPQMTTPMTMTMTPAPSVAGPQSQQQASTAMIPISMGMSLATPTSLPTQLLPMPTLEDIEVAAAPLQSLQQPQPLAQPLAPPPPTGILKYPTASSVGYVGDLLPPPPVGVGVGVGVAPPLDCGTLKSNAKLLPLQLVSNAPPPTRKEVPLPPTTSSSSSQSQQQRQRRQGGWCACFGSGPSTSEAKTPPGYGTKSKKRKQTVQTVWSALLTNLGICMLLLAYTLLGSFIFLTIENEDSALLHQQHTLASTKRNMALANGHSNGIYQQQRSQQQQQQQQAAQQHHQAGQHTDNDTVAAAVAQGQDLAHERNNGGIYGPMATNDFVYGLDELDAMGAQGQGQGQGQGQPQFALSPDTYDVRQRTIENIWDITVSLNILYKENWTKLAALEIAKFQDQLIKRLNEDVMLQLSHDDVAGGPASSSSSSSSSAGRGAAGAGAGAGGANNPATEAVLLHSNFHHHRLAGGGVGGPPHEWNFAKAFLYSLTVLTTIGYGNIAPRTALGRIVTVAYAFFGIPLTLVYLSSTGSILARVAREVFSKALCCCLCSNCGYCCYDEKRMAEKERRMKRKRQQEELRKQQSVMQEPYYVRDVYHATPEKLPPGGAGAGGAGTGAGSSGSPPCMPGLGIPSTATTTTSSVGPGGAGGVGAAGLDIDSLSASESRGSMHGLSILAPILLCFSMMIIYIVFGAAVLYRLENWPLIDGVYFCFMSLSTIGFGDMLPGLRRESNATTWFCSVYIMSGMTLTAMCFNVIHEEIVHRIRIVVEFKKSGGAGSIAGAGAGGGSLMDDYVNHELVPILTMDPNGCQAASARLALSQPAPVYTPASASASVSAASAAATANPTDGMDYTTLAGTLLEGAAQSPGQGQAQGQVKGVYTLAEETELELQAVHTETQVERV